MQDMMGFGTYRISVYNASKSESNWQDTAYERKRKQKHANILALKLTTFLIEPGRSFCWRS